MLTFSALLGVAVIAYRVFVKGESIIVKNPNWKVRGLACLVMGLSLSALSMYFLIATYIHQLPVLKIIWVMLALGIVGTMMGVQIMKRSSTSRVAD